MKQIIIRITLVISLVELVIMICFSQLPHSLGQNTQTVLDVVLLTLVSSPVIYLWIIKPFVISRDQALEQLTNMAYKDHLTDLPNRRFLVQCIEKFIEKSVKDKFYWALILIDLDNFKPINDIHGHNAGDAVLIELSSRMNSILRANDIAGRVGGDEFIILLNHLSTDITLAKKEAISISRKLKTLLNEHIIFGDKNLLVGSSFGICVLGYKEIGVEAAIREADIAMYRAKKDGKGKIVLFD